MGKVPQSRRMLSGVIRDQQRQITDKGTTWTGTGIHFPEPGVVEVEGEFRGSGFDGDLSTDDVGTKGFALSATKAAMPELLLRPGSIGNDTLTNPVVPRQQRASANNFALTPAWSYVAEATFTVPAGYSQALITGIVGCSANNSTASSDYLFADIAITAMTSSLPGYTIGSALIESGAGGISWQSSTVLLTDLDVASFDVQAAVSTQSGSWAASAGNVLNLDATVLFLR